MSELKQKVIKAINQHINISDTYTYELMRDKQGFQSGTIELDDFEEWNEDDVSSLADYIVIELEKHFIAQDKKKAPLYRKNYQQY